ncbi:glycine/D-amino acid oxidase-like deaminating enzyme [Ancylobacter sp. 3268]|uniref:NAD(P)/FAD-dependent oxidoreductase n=1 Tax=Ancylobacter sp. 3268 TaxID=2817752 RepID=UPI002864F09F|nr:FAD-binding oxidoreductase [Ancylobacter sp. 3268]MDR6953108.1 glycine/D-amino acid oxidase-like deaminating enzyme [Ancylobacter sp. 3268]
MTLARPLPPNVYQLDATPAPDTPPLDGSRRTSVAIIGGGIVGLTTALHLAEAGTDVVVLEANEPGWGASGNNGGQLNPGLKFEPDVIEETWGPELGRRMVSFAWDTPTRTLELIARLGIACDAHKGGTLRVARSAKAREAVEATARQCIARGMPVSWLDGTQTQAATGTPAYHGAMLDARGGNLNPLAYSRGLARAALAAGARVHGGTPATALHRTASGWSVETPAGTVAAEKILIATNGFTGDLWKGLRQTIVPVFSAIAATEPLSAAQRAGITPDRPSVYESGRITVYYRIDAQGRLLMGGRGPMQPIATPDPIAYLTDYAVALWPQLQGVRWTHGWNSQLAMTKDHWPHVHEPSPDALIYLGCNGRGVALGTALARQLAGRLLQGAAFQLDLPIMQPKPIAFHAFWPLGVRAAVLHGRLMDRLGL